MIAAALLAWRIRAAMLIGILATTAVGLVTGVAKWAPQPFSLSDLGATAGKLDIAAALRIGLVEIVFVFLFIDLFDNLGTLVAVGTEGQALRPRPPHSSDQPNPCSPTPPRRQVVGSLVGARRRW